jgi:hypothetical protein
MTAARRFAVELAAKDGDTACMSTERILRNTWWWHLS